MVEVRLNGTPEPGRYLLVTSMRQPGKAAGDYLERVDPNGTSLGIVVDDTVHLLAKYLRARREQGLDRPEAIRYAFRTVGKAILSTTVILSVGFAVLAASTFRLNAQMGLLTSLAILIALPVDFLLLPALLMIGHKTSKAQEEVPGHEDETIPVPA